MKFVVYFSSSISGSLQVKNRLQYVAHKAAMRGIVIMLALLIRSDSKLRLDIQITGTKSHLLG